MKRWIKELTYSRPFAAVVLWPLLIAGVLQFRITGRTPWASYWAMRRLYCVTRGRSNRWLVRRLGKPPAQAAAATSSAPGILGSLAGDAQRGIVERIERDGYSQLPGRLSSGDCEALIEFARATPARLIPAPPGRATAMYDERQPLAIKYDLPEDRVVAHPVVQRLLVDESLRDLARRYLGCEPINDLVAMWWSTAASSVANSEVAQLYHFDMDRPQFLKIFFYLTDVSGDTGPHCYVRGSHRVRPAPLWRDGRHDDADVLALYGADAEAEITAPRGTLIAVDTSGFHKGKPLVQGHRLILQLEYTSVLFGQEFQRIRVDENDFWRREMALHPHYFSRFSAGSA